MSFYVKLYTICIVLLVELLRKFCNLPCQVVLDVRPSYTPLLKLQLQLLFLVTTHKALLTINGPVVNREN